MAIHVREFPPSSTILLKSLAAGGVHIWDRDNGALLHYIQTRGFGSGDLTCVAWSPAVEPYMFATGTHVGSVKMWTPPPNVSRSPDSEENE